MAQCKVFKMFKMRVDPDSCAWFSVSGSIVTQSNGYVLFRVAQTLYTAPRLRLTHSWATGDRALSWFVSSCFSVRIGPIYQVLGLLLAEGIEDIYPWRNTHTLPNTHLWNSLPKAHAHDLTNNNCDITGTIPICQSWPQPIKAMCRHSHTSLSSPRPVDYLPIWLQPFSPLRN